MRRWVPSRVQIGRFHEKPVGPHPAWTYQLAFDAAEFAFVVGWLALNHGALDVFIHPNTGDELIAAIDRWAPPPRPQPSEDGPVSPDRDEVTGFIFKVQANMDPNHRDRIAFMRQVSGTFKRGMKLTPSGLGKPIAVHSPILFFAQDREIADTAEAGDIIGIPNHGTLRVGDTLSESNKVRFTGLPNFAPEILRRVVLKDPTKTKQLRKALDDLSEEGVIQVFYPEIGAQSIVGVVGQLQQVQQHVGHFIAYPLALHLVL